MIEVTLIQIYVTALVVAFLAFIFGCLIARSGYKDKYHKELLECKAELDKAIAERDKAIASKQRDISHAVTKEWNKGYNAAFEKLKQQFLYIAQWEREHGMTPGELETLAQNFETSNEEDLNNG